MALGVGQVWRTQEPSESGIRAKGTGASLGWVVRRGERTFRGDPAQALRANDAVRFTVSAREPVYVAIFGLDASGRAIAYFPDGAHLARVEPGRDRLLDAAIELDASPDDERVSAVFCRGPEPLAIVREAIEASAQPALPDGCTSERWVLRRERP